MIQYVMKLVALLLCTGAISTAWSAEPVLPVCAFDVEAEGEPSTLQLAVTVRCQPHIARLEFDAADRASIHAVLTLSGAAAAETDRGWRITDGGLRYLVDLRERVAAGGRSRDVALTNDTIMTPLDTWLGMPEPTRSENSLTVRLRVPPGLYAMHAMTPDGADTPDTFTLSAEDLTFAGYAIFSTRPGTQIMVSGRTGSAAPITVHAAADDFAIGSPALVEWVDYFSRLSAAYWQGFPVDRLLVAILPSGKGDNVAFGRVRGGGGATLQVVVGRGATPATLYRQDWILTHELLHLAQPNIGRDGMWLMEGMATYVEPILRHIAGLYSADQVWREWLRGMPTGALGVNTTGLTRANPYWGGALALLSSNVAILQQSQGRATITDCLRNGLQVIGNATKKAQPAALIGACDEASGIPALSEFAKTYGSAAEFDLPKLWQKLGISQSNKNVVFSNDAKSAALRAAILAIPQGFAPPQLPPRIAPLN